MAKTKIIISMTFETLLESENHLAEFGKMNGLPITVSFKYAKVLKELTEELKIINEEKMKLVKKHKLDLPENVGNKELEVAANKEWKKFISENEIKVNFEPISLASLKDVSISPFVMKSLLPFFTE